MSCAAGFHKNEFGYAMCWVEAVSIGTYGVGEPRTGFGVYFGPNHPCNMAKCIKDEEVIERAELQATIAAIKALKNLDVWMIQINTSSACVIQCAREFLPELDPCRPLGVAKLATVGKAHDVACSYLEIPLDIQEKVFDLSDAAYGAAMIYEKVADKASSSGSMEASKLALAGAFTLPLPGV